MTEQQQIDEEEQAARQQRKEIASVPMESGADFRVDNDDRAITDVAREVLVRAGWLTGRVSR